LFIVYKLILKGESGFNVSGKIVIQDCRWNLEGKTITQNEHNHFYLIKGIFECYRTVITPYNNTFLRFLNSTLSFNNLNISDLTFSNIKINEDYSHFTFIGDTNISDSVYFIMFCLNLFLGF
jgi:hypothetical protein